MYQCLELAGFAAAQAVCCLFDRVPLHDGGFAVHRPKFLVNAIQDQDLAASHGQALY
jgi:hypothetical protein